MPDEADQIAAGMIRRWSERFERLDAEALSSLYSRNAFFFGSNPNLYRGRDGVVAYFKGLPRWTSQRAEFSEVRAAQVSPELINMAAVASFFLDGGEAPALVVKITWVVVREDGDWKIASHHVSSKTPLL
jgi:uncharacterized protein (TIGR02246 family)